MLTHKSESESDHLETCSFVWMNLVGWDATFLLYSWQSPHRPSYFFSVGLFINFSIYPLNILEVQHYHKITEMSPKKRQEIFSKKLKFPFGAKSISCVLCFILLLVKPSQLIRKTACPLRCLISCASQKASEIKTEFPVKTKKPQKHQTRPHAREENLQMFFAIKIDDLMSRRSWSAVKLPRYCGNHKSRSWFCLFSMKSLKIRKKHCALEPTRWSFIHCLKIFDGVISSRKLMGILC